MTDAALIYVHGFGRSSVDAMRAWRESVIRTRARLAKMQLAELELHHLDEAVTRVNGAIESLEDALALMQPLVDREVQSIESGQAEMTEQEAKVYGERLAALTDDELVKSAESQIWLSAFAANNPRAPSHRRADLAHDEAERRGKPWLYQQAWNRAYESCGYQPSREQIRAAHPDPLAGVSLNKTELFLLEWLAKEDASALGECKGATLDGLIAQGLVRITNPDAGDYASVALTALGQRAHAAMLSAASTDQGA